MHMDNEDSCIFTYLFIYLYVHIERERESERQTDMTVRDRQSDVPDFVLKYKLPLL